MEKCLKGVLFWLRSIVSDLQAGMQLAFRNLARLRVYFIASCNMIEEQELTLSWLQLGDSQALLHLMEKAPRNMCKPVCFDMLPSSVALRRGK